MSGTFRCTYQRLTEASAAAQGWLLLGLCYCCLILWGPDLPVPTNGWPTASDRKIEFHECLQGALESKSAWRKPFNYNVGSVTLAAMLLITASYSLEVSSEQAVSHLPGPAPPSSFSFLLLTPQHFTRLLHCDLKVKPRLTQNWNKVASGRRHSLNTQKEPQNRMGETCDPRQ